jgi:hypothetical protein
MSKPEQLRGSPSGLEMELSSSFDQPSPFDQSTKVLFVKPNTCKRLYDLLQLQESELIGEKLENNRSEANLTPQSSQGCRDNSAMIETHRKTRNQTVLHRSCHVEIFVPCEIMVEPALVDQTRLVQ